MPVDRCVCLNVTFAKLREYATEHGADSDVLRRVFGCGNGCGLCMPYIEMMLATGRTAFDPVAPPTSTMTQLPDYPQAIESALRSAKPLNRAERVPLYESAGRVLVEPVVADRDLPPFDRAQMDGFALRSSEYEEGQPFRIVGTVPAGSTADVRVPSGCCVRIATGAPVPHELDLVIQHEKSNVQSPGAEIIAFLLSEIRPGMNVHFRGSDARKDDVVVEIGTLIASQHMGIAAAVGCSSLCVAARPRVAILTSGDEVLPADAAVKMHQIRNSNQPMLRDLFARMGAQVIEAQHLQDNLQQTVDRVKQAVQSHDLVVTVGGVSAGERDYFPAAFDACGVDVSLKGAAIQPGRPIVVGRAPSGCTVVGLPGNPVSALACACLFIWPIVRTMLGLASALPWCEVRLDEAVKPNPNRRAYRPAILNELDNSAVVPKWAGSGDLVHTATTHGLVELPMQSDVVTAGTALRFLAWP